MICPPVSFTEQTLSGLCLLERMFPLSHWPLSKPVLKEKVRSPLLKPTEGKNSISQKRSPS